MARYPQIMVRLVLGVALYVCLGVLLSALFFMGGVGACWTGCSQMTVYVIYAVIAIVDGLICFKIYREVMESVRGRVE